MTATTEARPIADNELLIVRTFDAPAALVFRIWEERAHAIRWWGPKDWTTPVLDMDFRVGGKWRACIVKPGGQEMWMSGVYRTIERDRRLVFTFQWENGNEQPGFETLITVTFAETGGKTVQTFHQTPFQTVEYRDNHIKGWTQFIDKEQGYAEALATEEKA